MDIIEQLLQKKEEHLKQISAINTLLESYGYDLEKPTTVIAENQSEYKKGKRFPKGKTYMEQIVHIFEQENRFLHNIEISKIIAKEENIKDVDWVKKRMSAELSKARRKNEIEGLVNFKFGKATKDTVWGFDYWMDDAGKIKEKYMYLDKNSL